MMVSDSLKLDIPTLKGLHYHWFWGLGYSKTPHPMNIGIEVEELLKNKQKLTYMIESQLALSQHHAVVRFFYWLFNIHNYSYHAYVLAAYNEHQQYLHDSMENNSSMQLNNKEVLGLGLLGVALAYAIVKIHRILKLAPTNGASSNAIVKQDDIKGAGETMSPSSALIDAASVPVTRLMQPHLIVLGINKNTGDLLSFSDFKATCRARYLATHPDKPGGTKEEFCRVKEAADRLTKMMSSGTSTMEEHSLSNNLSKRWADFYESMNKLEAQLAKFKAEDEAVRAQDKAEIDMRLARVEAALIEISGSNPENTNVVPLRASASDAGFFASDTSKKEAQESSKQPKAKSDAKASEQVAALKTS